MFERFTDSAKRVVTMAGGLALVQDCAHVTTGHILIQLHQDGGVVGAAMTALGYVPHVSALTRPDSFSMVSAQTGDNSSSRAVRPLSPDVKRAIEHTLVIALQLGHNYISNEHLALGLAEAERTTGDDRSLDAEEIMFAASGRTLTDLKQVLRPVIVEQEQAIANHRAALKELHDVQALKRRIELMDATVSPADG